MLRETVNVDLADSVAALLMTCREIGVVLDYAFHAYKDLSLERSHERAARRFLHARFVQSQSYREQQIRNNARILAPKPRLDLNALTGSQIAYADFWEPKAEEDSEFSVADYRSAFLDPPYGLRGERKDHERLFDELNSLLFDHREPSDYQIWSWRTDCSSYFDEGSKWWGAFLWTISTTPDNQVTVIAAAASD